MKLNLAAGDDRRDGFVSVDWREDVADVVCDVAKLEHWADGSVDELLALDILEHFPVFSTFDVLTEWRRVLVEGGRLTVRVPNMERLARALLDGSSPDLVVRNIYGGHRFGPDGMWDAHHTGWTPETLRRDLEAAGFDVWSNDEALNMTVECTKVGP